MPTVNLQYYVPQTALVEESCSNVDINYKSDKPVLSVLLQPPDKLASHLTWELMLSSSTILTCQKLAQKWHCHFDMQVKLLGHWMYKVQIPTPSAKMI